MLVRLPAADARIIGRGVVVLVLVIALGVAAVENQLNHLTARSDFVQVLNLRRDGGYYHAYFFGQSWGLRAIYPVGALASDGDSLTVAVAGRQITVPTAVRIELAGIVYWLDLWRGQFVAAALRTKRDLTGYWDQVRPFLRGLADAVKGRG